MDVNSYTLVWIWKALRSNLAAKKSSITTADKLSREDARGLADLAREAGFPAGIVQAQEGTWQVTAKSGA